MSAISIIISSLALLISVATFWLTRIKKGVIRMTRPTIICLASKNGGDPPKIFIRTLLYSTSEQGQYVQNMFVRVQREGLIRSFNVWAYGDKGLVRGSGLRVDKNGVSNYHHFLLPKNESDYQFSKGDYVVQIFVETINGKPINIFEQILSVPDIEQKDKTAIYFDWEPDKQEYSSHTDIGSGLPSLLITNS